MKPNTEKPKPKPASKPDSKLASKDDKDSLKSFPMAVGARLLSKKEVVVTKLSAIEELAGVDILCSDKTGTLTQNKQTLGDPFTVNNIPADQVILWAALASRAEDMVVISTHGISGWHPLVFGSIAEKVVKLVQCPILLLRSAKPESDRKTPCGRASEWW